MYVCGFLHSTTGEEPAIFPGATPPNFVHHITNSQSLTEFRPPARPPTGLTMN